MFRTSGGGSGGQSRKKEATLTLISSALAYGNEAALVNDPTIGPLDVVEQEEAEEEELDDVADFIYSSKDKVAPPNCQ